MQKKTFIGLLILIFFIASCKQQTPPVTDKSQAQTNGANATPSPAQVLEVSTTAVVARDSTNILEITGNLEGQEEITISSEVEGTIAAINFDFGNYIKSGDQMLSLDTRELELKVKQAEANVAAAEAHLGPVGGPQLPQDHQPDILSSKLAMDQAKLELDRAEKLLNSGDIARQDFDRIKNTYDQAQVRYGVAFSQVNIYQANLEQARAQLSIARKQMADAVIKAPVGGAIKERLVGKGEYLTKGRNVARIVQIDTLRLRGNVPEQYINNLNTGLNVQFQVESMPDTKFEGTLTRISPSVDKNSRSLMVEAAVKNPKLQLKPGMFVRAVINTNVKNSVLMVPQKSVLTAAGLNKVYLFIDGQARAKEIKVGRRDGEMIEVLEGLKVDDQVITNDVDKLADGSPVKRHTA